MSYEDFLDLGAEVPDKVLEARIAGVNADDVATIVYTSGTTGIPEGRGSHPRQRHVHRPVRVGLGRKP